MRPIRRLGVNQSKDQAEPPNCDLAFVPDAGGTRDATTPDAPALDAGGDASPTDASPTDAAAAPVPTFGCTDTDAGMIAYYAFDEGEGGAAYDCMPGGGLGVLKGGDGGPAWVAGHRGFALRFFGKQYVDLGTQTKFGVGGAATISMWINADASLLAYVFSEYSGNWSVYLNAGAANFAYRGTREVWSVPLVPNVWHHVAAVFRPSNAYEIYVDGTNVQSAPTDAGPAGTLISQVLFGGYSTAGIFYTGLLDEVRVFNRDLSVAEIQALAKP